MDVNSTIKLRHKPTSGISNIIKIVQLTTVKTFIKNQKPQMIQSKLHLVSKYSMLLETSSIRSAPKQQFKTLDQVYTQLERLEH